MVPLKEIENCPEVAAKLNAAQATNVLAVNWVKPFSTEYQPGLIVCVDVADEMPVFCKINYIIVKDEQAVLAGSVVETVCFEEHYHAFKILFKSFQALPVFDMEELLYFKPVDVQMAYGPTESSLFIVPYCHLMKVESCI